LECPRTGIAVSSVCADVDAISDRVRREAPCFADDAAGEKDAIGDRVYISARQCALVARHPHAFPKYIRFAGRAPQ
jgi:hypothetical protein